MRKNRLLVIWLISPLGLLWACQAPSSDREFCESEYGIRFQVPTGWEPEPRTENPSSIVQLRSADENPILDFAVTVTPSTPDARNLGGAANRLGFVLTMGNQARKHDVLDLVHPEYDTSSATTDSGTEVTHNVWMVLDDQGGPQVLVHLVAPESRHEDVALLRALVESVRYPGEACPRS